MNLHFEKAKFDKVKFLKLVIGLVFIAALTITYYLGLLDPAIKFLDSDELSFMVGKNRYSAYKIVKSIIAIVVIFWTASRFTDFIESRFKKHTHFNPSNRELIVKVLQIAIFFIALLTTMDALGIDLKALTIFGGALGIGIGFGLQKITSNFMSGIIILLEKSVREGDVLQLSDGTNGFIRKISARYSLLETGDGKEFLIPNEEMITQRVINWTLSSAKARVTIEVGVDYSSDMGLVRKLLIEAAASHSRSSKVDKPTCFMDQFAESAVIFKLQVWVDDVRDGRNDIRSDIMFKILEEFKENNISIPYPQRELKIISPENSTARDNIEVA